MRHGRGRRISALVRRIGSRYLPERGREVEKTDGSTAGRSSRHHFCAAPHRSTIGRGGRQTARAHHLRELLERAARDCFQRSQPTGLVTDLGRAESWAQFTLSRPTVLAHVGAFVNAYPPNYSAEGGSPFRTEIRRADVNGLPADGDPLAVAVMTDDHDAATWRYESAAFRLLLQPGTYFALVSADIPPDDDHAFPGGVLVGTDEGGAVTYLA